MATTYDKASLVMIPSGYKDDKLYSIKPTDGSGDFTFSRDGAGASPATRVNASGLIEKGRTNELLQSNNFGTTWVNSNTTETGGQSGYDGSSDAWQLTAASTGSSRIIGQNNATTGVSTFSVYAKAGNINYLALENGTDFAYISLIDGSVGNSGGTNYITYTSTDVGGGWWRVSITFNKVASSDLRIYLASSGTSTAVNSGDYIYIQDAQLEQGLVATDYIETTTAPVSAGLLGDMPRLDYHNPDSPTPNSCPSLLLEPSRVNLFHQSEYYNAYYTRDGVSVTDNALTSPEGLQNASKLVEDSANSKHRIGKATFPSGTQRTLSVFAKAGERNYISLFENNAVGNDVKGTIFNLSNGTLSINNSPTYYSNPTIEPIGSSGWYRCSVTWTPASLSVPSFGVSADGLENTYQGDGTSGIYIYGTQLEEGSYPTSYIPTYGSASTRGVDVANKLSASSLIGQTEGTIYCELKFSALTGAEDLGIWMRTGATSYNEMIALFIGNDFKAKASVRSSASQEVLIASEVLSEGTIKMAFAYKQNDFVFYVNGVSVGTDTNGNVPTCDQIYLAGYPDGGTRRAENKQTLLFKSRLTNAELAALTA